MSHLRLLFSCSLFLTLPAVVQAHRGEENTSSRNQSAASKDVSQFCIAKLDPERQEHYYNRMMAFGASFSHGCMGCDYRPLFRENYTRTDDSFWVRRNPIVRFWAGANWQNSELDFTKIAIAENDARYRASSNIPANQLELEGYDGLWTYNTKTDNVSLMDSKAKSFLENYTSFFKETNHIGGIVKNQGQIRNNNGAGVLFYSLSQPHHSDTSRFLFDLSVDGGRMEHIFQIYGDAKLYNELEATGWTDRALRKELINTVVTRISSIQPTIIFALDILFWDSFSHSIALFLEKSPRSITGKVISKLYSRSSSGKKDLDLRRRINITADFYETFASISNAANRGGATPVLVGRTMRDAKLYFKQNPELIGALLSQFMRAQTGLEITPELEEERKKIEYRESSNQQSLSAAKPKALDPFGTEVSKFSELKSAVANVAAMNVFGDLDLFIESLDEAFKFSNTAVDNFTSLSSNNIYSINADPFYQNFSSYLKPDTMHPDVSGAIKIANFLENGLCDSSGSIQ